MRPFGGDRWWLLALSVIFAAVLIVAAGRYAARRDLGRGLLPVQTGRAQASRGLLGSFGLAWRLQRSAFVAWLVGTLGFGLIFGSVAESAINAEGSMREWYQKMAATSQMLDAFIHVDDRDSPASWPPSTRYRYCFGCARRRPAAGSNRSLRLA